MKTNIVRIIMALVLVPLGVIGLGFIPDNPSMAYPPSTPVPPVTVTPGARFTPSPPAQPSSLYPIWDYYICLFPTVNVVWENIPADITIETVDPVGIFYVQYGNKIIGRELWLESYVPSTRTWKAWGWYTLPEGDAINTFTISGWAFYDGPGMAAILPLEFHPECLWREFLPSVIF